MTEPQGIKDDKEKVRLDLLSPRWVQGVGEVLTFGARKYAAHNWRKGIQITRLLAACLRHVFAFLSGEDRDPETGLSHLLHASCCLMFAYETMEMRPDMDDRWKALAPTPPMAERDLISEIREMADDFEVRTGQRPNRVRVGITLLPKLMRQLLAGHSVVQDPANATSQVRLFGMDVLRGLSGGDLEVFYEPDRCSETTSSTL